MMAATQRTNDDCGILRGSGYDGKRAPNQPVTVALTIFAGVYVKAYTVPDAGTLLPQHSHSTGHVTAVTAGAVRVWRDGALVGDFQAPELVLIPARRVTFVSDADRSCRPDVHPQR